MKYAEKCPDLKDGVEEFQILIKEAHDYYVSGKLNLTDLAVRYPQIPSSVLKKYAKENGWELIREQMAKDIELGTVVDYLVFIHQNRTKVAQHIVDSFLPLIDKLRDGLIKALDDNKTTDIRRLAESTKQIVDLIQAAVGMNGTVPELPTDAEDIAEALQNKTSWMSMHNHGPVSITQAPTPSKPTPGGDAKVVDVELEDTPNEPQED